jgi:hypothetical protein
MILFWKFYFILFSKFKNQKDELIDVQNCEELESEDGCNSYKIREKKHKYDTDEDEVCGELESQEFDGRDTCLSKENDFILEILFFKFILFSKFKNQKEKLIHCEESKRKEFDGRDTNSTSAENHLILKKVEFCPKTSSSLDLLTPETTPDHVRHRHQESTKPNASNTLSTERRLDMYSDRDFSPNISFQPSPVKNYFPCSSSSSINQTSTSQLCEFIFNF